MSQRNWMLPNPPTLFLDDEGNAPVDHGTRLADPLPLPELPPTDWRTVPLAPLMHDMPRDVRGFPVPYHLRPHNFVSGGVADLRRLNNVNLYLCLKERRCGICGKKIQRTLVLSGGAHCVMNRAFTEPPFHEACVRYAHRVCPFITRATFGHHDRPEDIDKGYLRFDKGGVGKEKQLRHCLYFTEDYAILPRPNEIPIIIAKDAKAVEWYDMDARYLCRTRPQQYGQ